MSKVDLKKDLKHLYSPSKKDFGMVDVPPMPFLMVDGAGPPGSPEYVEAVQALYSVAYPLKFLSKNEAGKDFVVMPLQGLWWAENMDAYTLGNRDEWLWTMMILQPDWITEAMVTAAIEQTRKKKDLPGLDKVRFETYHEGKAAQILYLGPYADEGPTIAALHDFIEGQGYRLSGKHHEIYLSDPGRTAPEKLKTVIRQPCLA